MSNAVFVYGTLKRGFGNHILLDNSESEFLGDAKTSPDFTMFSMGGFPGCSKIGSTEIVGEVYNVSDRVLERLDSLEGHPEWYTRQRVLTTLGPAWMYLQKPEDMKNNEKVLSGVWEPYAKRVV